MIKAISAIAAAAAIAAAITFSPGFAPEVEAGQTTDAGQTTIAKAEAPAPAVVLPDSGCAAQSWPNIDAACLRGRGNTTIQPVRVITTDRR
jgi:hypothetical protein